MRFEKYLKIIVLLSSLVLIPDLILSLSGRDTYLITHGSYFIDVGILTSFLLLFFVGLELFRSFNKKEWRRILLVSFATVLVVISCKMTLSHLVNKSIYEAEIEVHKFLSDRETLSGELDVSIDDRVKEIYGDFESSDKSLPSVALTRFVPNLRFYDFEISPNNSRPFFIRFTVSQTGKSKIWIHSKAVKPGRTKLTDRIDN